MALTAIASPPNRHLVKLQQRYRDLCLQPPLPPSQRAVKVATYMPSAGDALTFDRPVAPVGSVLLCELGHHATDQTDVLPRHYDESFRNNFYGNFRGRVRVRGRVRGRGHFRGGYFRGHRARYVPNTGQTVWGNAEDWFDFSVCAQAYATDRDQRLLHSPKLLDVLIGLHEVRCRTADTLTDHHRLTLPPTLLGFPPEMPPTPGRLERTGTGVNAVLIKQLSSRPTMYVSDYMYRYGVSASQAWRELDAATRPGNDIQMTGLRLVDARLCIEPGVGTRHLPPVLKAFHDLRGLLGRRLSNPARKLPTLQCINPAAGVTAEFNHVRGHPCDPGQWTQAEADQAMARMRQRVGPLNVFFDDFDITEALINPDEPLRVHDFDVERLLREQANKTIARGLRGLLAPQIAAGCSDLNLLRAFENPATPLYADHLSRRQAWRVGGFQQ